MTAAPAHRRSPASSTDSGGRGAAPAAAALALFLAAAAGAPPCTAEEPPADPDLSTRRLRKLGPVYLRPFVTLKDVGYDDNVFFDADEPEGDTTATLAPGFQALLLGRHRGGLRLNQEFNYVAFRENSQINHWNSDTRARGILLAGPFVLSLEDRFRSIRERPSNEFDRRIRRESNDIQGEVRTRLSGRFDARARLGRESIRYVDGRNVEAISDQLDRNESTLAVAAEFRIRPRTTVFIETAYEDVNFRNPRQIRDSESISVLPGLRIDPSARIQGEVKWGITRLDAPEEGDLGDPKVTYDDYRGLIGEASVSARMGSASVARLQAERSLPFSLLSRNLYSIKTDWSAAFEQFFSRRFSVEARYGSALFDYPNRVRDSGGALSRRADRIETSQLSVKYRMGSELALTAGLQRQVRDSTDDELDRTRNFFTIGTSLLL